MNIQIPAMMHFKMSSHMFLRGYQMICTGHLLSLGKQKRVMCPRGGIRYIWITNNFVPGCHLLAFRITLALCVGNPPVTGGFPCLYSTAPQRSEMWRFYALFVLVRTSCWTNSMVRHHNARDVIVVGLFKIGTARSYISMRYPYSWQMLNISMSYPCVDFYSQIGHVVAGLPWCSQPSLWQICHLLVTC